jgi:hypothetical protein
VAVLTSPRNFNPVYVEGRADVVALFALKDVTTGDTADLAPWFQVINRAVAMGITQFVEIAATFTGTVVTIPAGLATDSAYLLAWGSGA